MNSKRSKRWDGELASLTPEYLNDVMRQMAAYGDRVRFGLNSPTPQPHYQVINAFEKKMAFDARHHLHHPADDEFDDANATRILSLDQVKALMAGIGSRREAAARPVRASRVRSTSGGGRTVTAAQKIEENLDALKYAYFKEHSATLPEGIKEYSQEISRLMKGGMTAAAAFDQVVKQYF